MLRARSYLREVIVPLWWFAFTTICDTKLTARSSLPLRPLASSHLLLFLLVSPSHLSWSATKDSWERAYEEEPLLFMLWEPFSLSGFRGWAAHDRSLEIEYFRHQYRP